MLDVRSGATWGSVAHMKLTTAALLASIVLGLLLAYVGSARAAGTYSTPTTTACVSRAFVCAAGTCTESAPTTNTGTALEHVQGYVVRICADSGQTLSGAGTMRDYHCSATLSPACAQIIDNNLAVTATTVRCQEWAPFTVPYNDNTADTMFWSPSGVTVSAGDLTIYICPNS